MFLTNREYFPHVEGDRIVAYREHNVYVYDPTTATLLKTETTHFPHSAGSQSFYFEKLNFPYYAERAYYGSALQLSKTVPRILPFGITKLQGKLVFCDSDTLEIKGVRQLGIQGQFYLHAFQNRLLISGYTVFIYDALESTLLRFHDSLGYIQLVYQNFVLFLRQQEYVLADLNKQVCAALAQGFSLIATVVVGNFIFKRGRRYSSIESYLESAHGIDLFKLQFAALQLDESVKIASEAPEDSQPSWMREYAEEEPADLAQRQQVNEKLATPRTPLAEEARQASCIGQPGSVPAVVQRAKLNWWQYLLCCVK